METRAGERAGRDGAVGAILACLGDTEPSNDFESTRLVARIIQFEYVYGPAARTGRAQLRSHRCSRNSRAHT